MGFQQDNTVHAPGSDVVLRVDGLYKKFCRSLKHSMYYGVIDSIRSMIGMPYDTGVLRKNEFWALENVSLELRRGEALGIVGINGSGKSTLLRLITGIFPPDKGRIAFRGRIGALIAVGAGFHPHMTGRENIYLNGTILGMSRAELDGKLDDIIAFADIGDFLDAPVNTYSSGMRVRLGFAIAVHCEPDILLVDEVLSVGDLAFRNKSMRKMNELHKNAKGLIFISHNLEHIRVLCTRVIIMDHGKAVFDGPTDEGLIRYENLSKETRGACPDAAGSRHALYSKRKSDDNKIELKDVGLMNAAGEKISTIDIDDPMFVFIEFSLQCSLAKPYFILNIIDEQRTTRCIWIKSNDYGRCQFNDIEPGRYRVVARIPRHHLGPGVYYINYGIKSDESCEKLEQAETTASFAVVSDSRFERGVVCADAEWHIDTVSGS